MSPAHQFESKTSDAIRRRLSSVVSSKRPNVQAYSSLTVPIISSIYPRSDAHLSCPIS